MVQLVLQLRGARIYTPEGTAAAIDSREAAEAFDFMKDLIYTYHVMPTPAEEVSLANAGGWGLGGGITQFGSGQAAMALGGRWRDGTRQRATCTGTGLAGVERAGVVVHLAIARLRRPSVRRGGNPTRPGCPNSGRRRGGDQQ